LPPPVNFTQEKPIKAVKILGEELVVYRDKRGSTGWSENIARIGWLPWRMGEVDDEGICCPYHGWKFDSAGKLPGAAGGAGKQHVQGPDQTCRLSSGDTGWIDFRLLGPEPQPFVAAMGCAGLGKWQALDRQGIDSSTVIGCNRWRIRWTRRICFGLHGDTAHLAPRVKQ